MLKVHVSYLLYTDGMRQFIQCIVESRSPPLSLNDVLTPETLNRLLDDPEVCAQLYSHLPENCERSPEEVRQVVRSPQFQQAAATLSHAFESGDLGPLLQQLGLPGMSGGSKSTTMLHVNETDHVMCTM